MEIKKHIVPFPSPLLHKPLGTPHTPYTLPSPTASNPLQPPTKRNNSQQTMADKLQQTAQQTAGEGTKKWDAMTEEQKKQTFDNLPADQKKGKTYYEWITEGYHHQYENWMPWIEDQYLKWFSKDNKASYATKGQLPSPTLSICESKS